MERSTPVTKEKSASLKGMIRWGEEKLIQAGISNVKMEVAWLICDLLSKKGAVARPADIKPAELLLMDDESVPETLLQIYTILIEKRSKRVPLAYLLGCQEFMGLKILVNEDVLVPRQETEILVGEVLKRFPNGKNMDILDIGTGSGNISVSLAKNLEGAQIFATDSSDKAIFTAKKNAALHHVDNNIKFFNEALFGPLGKKYDIVVSNPPYIKSGDLNSLQAEVRYEPGIALDGGKDGLEVIKGIVSKSKKYLKKSSVMFLEVGYDQSESVQKMMRDAGFEKTESVKDYSGIERVVIGYNG